MSSPTIEPLRFDFQSAFFGDQGFSAKKLLELTPQLEAARTEVVETDLQLFADGESAIPDEKKPLDAGFLQLPERLLAEYYQDRRGSELGRIMQTAKRLREKVDRIVVLGIGGSYMGAKALMDACCQPFFNELSRGERGSYPRMYFEGNNVDNDATQGLLSLLGRGKKATTVDDSWAIVVISKSGGTLETAAAFRQFLAALESSCENPADVAQRVVPVTGTSGKLFDLATAIGCPDIYPVPDGVGGRFSILSAVGLLPAAILGINVLRLLEGAATINEHFRTAPVGQNAVLDYVGTGQLWEERGATIRVLSVWSKALEAVGLWHDQLLAESLGKDERGTTPLTTVNTRDLHSRAQQHQEGRRDKLISNLIVDQWRCDPLPIGHSNHDQDGLNRRANKTLPDIMSAAIAGTNQAYRDVGRPTADIHLPHGDEASLGQFFQMMMLATV
ncbi:MAG: glucose-6-phosphate isomerase, partial [Pirellulaceae bacterium]|nr:glucose-6-phosphate isomerase [Pirellulaceae bacterium]